MAKQPVHPIECAASGVLIDPSPSRKPVFPGVTDAVCPSCGQRVPVCDWPPRYSQHVEPADVPTAIDHAAAALGMLPDVLLSRVFDADRLVAERDAYKCSDPWLEAS